jgi:uncharacterized protein involved in exopolysaccharide biosynthesis
MIPTRASGDDIGRLVRAVRRARRAWRSGVLAAVLVVAVGAVAVTARAPTYRSEVVLSYRPGVKLHGQEPPIGLALGARLRELLFARAQLEAIVSELDLYPSIRARRGPGEAVEELRRDLQFQPRSLDTFMIAYRGASPELARQVTERLVRSLSEAQRRLRADEAQAQREFVVRERGQADVDLKERERVLASFVAAHPEFALDQRASSTGATIRVRERTARTSVPTRDSGLEALRRQAERIGAAIDAPSSPSLQRARDPEAEEARHRAAGAVAAAKDELRARRSRFTDEHPDVKAARSRLAEAEAQLRAVEDRLAEAASAEGARAPDASAIGEMRDKKRRIDAEIALRERAAPRDASAPSPAESSGSIVELETSWARLSRDLEEARSRVDELERSEFRAQIEASSQDGGYSDGLVVLDPPSLAAAPEPPNRSTLALATFVAALGLGVFVALVRAAVRGLVDGPDDLEALGAVVAVVPPRTTSDREDA